MKNPEPTTELNTELKKREILRLSNEESNKITKECLQTALIQLMNEKPFDKISITELVKRSGVSRSAFYRNYNSKEGILEEINQAVSDLMLKAFAHNMYRENPFKFYQDFFKRIKENASDLRLFLQANLQNNDAFLKMTYSEENSKLTRAQFYKNIAYKGALMEIVYEWFGSGMKEDVDEMAKLCTKILPF